MSEIKIRMRFDYPGQAKSGKLFGGKNLEQMAEDTRQHKVSMMRNVPIQGIRIEDIDMSQDIYALIDDITGKKVAYAPVIITFYADRIEDAIKFVIKEEFRTVEIIEPETIQFTKNDLEKLLFRISLELIEYRDMLLRKMDNWK